MSGSLTDVPGIRVGHWTGEGSGVTVILPDEPAVGAADLRGGAPAERELAVLDVHRTVERVDAVVFTGGSAFGLAAADGVMRWLADRGRGFPTRGGPVPIVPTAAIYDLVASGGVPPGPAEGAAAAAAADRGEPWRRGRVGAGRGATVGKWRGPTHAVPGGVGSASARVDDATVGALAVVNAIGDVRGATGAVLAGSTAPPGSPAFPDPEPFDADEPNTTLVVVATDARCAKLDCRLLAESAQHGVAWAVHPSHTRHDGDLVVALATGQVDAHLDRLRVVATEVAAAAVQDAVRPDDDGRR